MSNMSTKMSGALLVAALAVFALLTTLWLPVKAQGEAPHLFIGTAKSNGSPVGAGSTVTAWDGESQIGSATTTDGGNFTLQVSRSSGPISFQVDGATANETHSHWRSGDQTGSPSDRFILTFDETQSPYYPCREIDISTQGEPPHHFIGTAKADGSPVSAGKCVAAWDGNDRIGLTLTTAGGNFTLQVSRPSGTISFQVDGVTANETYSHWQEAGITGSHSNRFILTTGEADPQATPWPTSTPPPPPTPTPTTPYITLSTMSGPPGTIVTIRGGNFKDSVPVQSLSIGGVDVLPLPAPQTNSQGMTEFEILIPGLASGGYAIEVDVGGVSASVNFTVTEPDCNLATSASSPTITLSQNSGAPGSTITLRGEGFKGFMPVRSVEIGSFEVTPAPAPYTYCVGEMEFDIHIPGLDSGIHAITVQVNDATTSVDFNVTSPSNPSPTAAPTPTATPYPTPTPTLLPTPTPTPAPEPPQLPGSSEPPHIFAGTATLNGSPAGQGVAVDAYDGGRLIGATVTQAGGRFSIHVHRAEGVITFRVNNQAAAESWTAWQRGQVTTGFDLTAGGDGSRETDPARLFAALLDLVRAFGFDNATKQWDFFDPAAADVSTLTRFMPGNIYWLLVSRTTSLALNGMERDLFCVEEDCWNLIAW